MTKQKPRSAGPIICLALLVLLTLPLSCASQESPPQERITGTISIKGSDPRTFVALTDSEGKVYEIIGPLTELLAASYQHKEVTLQGQTVRQSVGPGMAVRFNAERIIPSGARQ